jgi:uncharacterized protein (DUF433 family)
MLERGVIDEPDVRHELIAPSDPRAGLVSIHPERLGGTPCFAGTRVPVSYLWEYLIEGKTLETFLEDFEGVPREEAIAVLKQSYERFMEGLPSR